MTRYKAWVPPRGNEAVDAMTAETRRLFEADLREIEVNPYSPRGLRTGPVKRDPDFREAVVADGKVLIHYRIHRDVLEIHVVRIIHPE